MKIKYKYLFIIQEVSNEERHKNGLWRLGQGYFTASRFNPYNPISYLAWILILMAGIVMFGIVGVWQHKHIDKPFKWY